MCQRQALLEQYFGYQVQDSGYLSRYAQAGSVQGRANYLPANPFRVGMEPGYTGAAYSHLDVRAVAPLFAGARYGGVLPITEQPRVPLPQPYTRGVVI